MLIIVDAVVILPGAVVSVVLGRYTAIVVVVLVSLTAWVAAYGVATRVRTAALQSKSTAPDVDSR